MGNLCRRISSESVIQTGEGDNNNFDIGIIGGDSANLSVDIGKNLGHGKRKETQVWSLLHP